MSSVAKALGLLSHFSTIRPEIGLSQLCRIAKRDKATTYRHLQALESAGFIEQNALTKQYRLGPAIMQLAEVREATVPRKEGARHVLASLADATGETAHATVLSAQTLYGLCDCESPHHAIRAVIDLNVFPLHATASGLCALAFGPDDLLDAAVKDLEAFTATTPSDKESLVALLESFRQTGIARADRSFAEETYGVAAPLFDQTGRFAGAVAVASVAARMTDSLEQTVTNELIVAAREITRNWGGTIPSHIEAAWARSAPQSNAMETTS